MSRRDLEPLLGLTLLAGLVLGACAPSSVNSVPHLTAEASNQLPYAASSPTRPSPRSPSRDLPLNTDNTWTYREMNYDTHVSGTPGTNDRTNTLITATYVISETIIKTQTVDPYFAAQIVRDTKMITSSRNLDSLVGPEWSERFLAGNSKRETYWYIIDGAKVYRQNDLDLSNVASSWLELMFPLTEKAWYPDGVQRGTFPDLSLGPSSGIRIASGPIKEVVPAGSFENCYEIRTMWLPGGTMDWFCRGIGFVGAKYDHMGTPQGYRRVLTSYSIR